MRSNDWMQGSIEDAVVMLAERQRVGIEKRAHRIKSGAGIGDWMDKNIYSPVTSMATDNIKGDLGKAVAEQGGAALRGALPGMAIGAGLGLGSDLLRKKKRPLSSLLTGGLIGGLGGAGVGLAGHNIKALGGLGDTDVPVPPPPEPSAARKLLGHVGNAASAPTRGAQSLLSTAGITDPETQAMTLGGGALAADLAGMYKKHGIRSATALGQHISTMQDGALKEYLKLVKDGPGVPGLQQVMQNPQAFPNLMAASGLDPTGTGQGALAATIKAHPPTPSPIIGGGTTPQTAAQMLPTFRTELAKSGDVGKKLSLLPDKQLADIMGKVQRGESLASFNPTERTALKELILKPGSPGAAPRRGMLSWMFGRGPQGHGGFAGSNYMPRALPYAAALAPLLLGGNEPTEAAVRNQKVK